MSEYLRTMAMGSAIFVLFGILDGVAWRSIIGECLFSMLVVACLWLAFGRKGRAT